MTASLFLSVEELSELTGRRRRNNQVFALRSMGIEHRVRPDGHVLVLRAHVESLLGGRMPEKSSSDWNPVWSVA
ncbi:DUF4224 domain-containing protein [Pandoraea fibrosis]|uniref:DUF4224 domain-containing protein n=1 Tax=Pandoraea fibrosis TaxID=1891094 RepID=A0ABX6HNA2_9BURK|nr:MULTISPECIES: DUF4224 domain-containing protein [Pandoraea]MDR3399964.1 DUF4224 domain-containing protein [Pandoraea sp.]QHE91168.1 DUF4224 domain-containing protein [Pandoraea fibrosis]QHF11999.1 DUF4224 domain-containing protein [Pandoraea fibrosis]RRW89720.1 DUF4224 domain-containing protein [Pandoraea apista]RRW99893.1 DUF4224 domain-containing protein [Pandoraea apista]